jgi:hypothetical protein
VRPVASGGNAEGKVSGVGSSGSGDKLSVENSNNSTNNVKVTANC